MKLHFHSRTLVPASVLFFGFASHSLAGVAFKSLRFSGQNNISFFGKPKANFSENQHKIIFEPTKPLGGNTIPVQLVNFKTILLNNRSVNLSWQTLQETNSNYFDVERSADGVNWRSIGREEASGNTTDLTNYAYLDQLPLKGAGYYRLKMVNEDGSFGYSEVSVMSLNAAMVFNVFPNPANQYVNVSVGRVSEHAVIHLFNQSGQTVFVQQLNNGSGSTVMVPVNHLSPGIYTVQVLSSDGSQQVASIIIVR
jgi:Secretion system C-terminal sorting domain